MSAAWLTIYGRPTRAFYTRTAEGGADAMFGAGASAHDTLETHTVPDHQTAFLGGRQNSAIDFTIRNPDGEFGRLFAVIPIGARADLRQLRDGEVVVLFSGVVTQLSGDTTIEGTVQA